MLTAKFRYIKRMHRELRDACPVGYTVSTIRVHGKVFTAIWCEAPNYAAPFLVRPIVQPHGFSTVFA